MQRDLSIDTQTLPIQNTLLIDVATNAIAAHEEGCGHFTVRALVVGADGLQKLTHFHKERWAWIRISLGNSYARTQRERVDEGTARWDRVLELSREFPTRSVVKRSALRKLRKDRELDEVMNAEKATKTLVATAKKHGMPDQIDSKHKAQETHQLKNCIIAAKLEKQPEVDLLEQEYELSQIPDVLIELMMSDDDNEDAKAYRLSFMRVPFCQIFERTLEQQFGAEHQSLPGAISGLAFNVVKAQNLKDTELVGNPDYYCRVDVLDVAHNFEEQCIAEILLGQDKTDWQEVSLKLTSGTTLKILRVDAKPEELIGESDVRGCTVEEPKRAPDRPFCLRVGLNTQDRIQSTKQYTLAFKSEGSKSKWRSQLGFLSNAPEKEQDKKLSRTKSAINWLEDNLGVDIDGNGLIGEGTLAEGLPCRQSRADQSRFERVSSRVTTVVEAKGDPAWNQVLQFSPTVNAVELAWEAESIKITILDEDFGADDVVGYVGLRGGMLVRKDLGGALWIQYKEDEWVKANGAQVQLSVIGNGLAQAGTIDLRFERVSIIPRTLWGFVDHGYQLRIHAFSGRDMPTDDIYLTFTLGRHKSGVTKSSTTKQWFQTIVMHNIRLLDLKRFAETVDTGLCDELVVQAWCKRTRSKRCVGSRRISMNTIVKLSKDMERFHKRDIGASNAVPKQWFTLLQSGQTKIMPGNKSSAVLLSFEIAILDAHKPNKPQRRRWLNPQDDVSGMKCPNVEYAKLLDVGDGTCTVDYKPATRRAEVEVHVVGCRELNSGAKKASYFLTVEIDGSHSDAAKADGSTVANACRSPNFLETIKIEAQIPTDPSFAPSLRIEAHKLKKGRIHGSECLGTACIGLRNFLPWVPSNRSAAKACQATPGSFSVVETEMPDPSMMETLVPWMQGRRVKSRERATAYERCIDTELEEAMVDGMTQHMRNYSIPKQVLRKHSEKQHRLVAKSKQPTPLQRFQWAVRFKLPLMMPKKVGAGAMKYSNTGHSSLQSAIFHKNGKQCGRLKCYVRIKETLGQSDGDEAARRNLSVNRKESRAEIDVHELARTTIIDGEWPEIVFQAPSPDTTAPVRRAVAVNRGITKKVVRFYITGAILNLVESGILGQALDIFHSGAQGLNRASNWLEQRLGIDLDGDGDVGEIQGIQHEGDGHYLQIFIEGQKEALGRSEVVNGNPSEPVFEWMFQTEQPLPAHARFRIEVPTPPNVCRLVISFALDSCMALPA